ncbi:MAG: hypothetical protein KC619_13390 [Myxococcales bacterium]|nr:hypothetical protein [Myxococcales bacterium]
MFGRNADLSTDQRANETRKCAGCGQPAVRVYHVTRHYVNSIPAGRTYEHRCHACGVQFRTISTWRAIREAFFVMLMVPIGLVMLGVGAMDLSDHWWAILVGLLFVGVAGLISWSTGKALLQLSKNPPA